VLTKPINGAMASLRAIKAHLFPRHNAIGDGEFGNEVRGQLGIHRGASRHFWFYGTDYTLEILMACVNLYAN
jgi:hypothetical protein